jgi:hypothetical protein
VAGSVLRFGALTALVAGLLTLAPAAQGRGAVSLTLEVTFTISADILVTKPDGTPVGATRGAVPTVIPAGYYTLSLSQAGCIDVPDFTLQGPGVDLVDNLDVGEEMNKDIGVVFLPNSTYTWRNASVVPSVIHTFMTSDDVLGTPPPPGKTVGGYAGGHGVSSGILQFNGDIVGSALFPFRGALTAAVSASGRLSVTRNGKQVTRLSRGWYKLTVTDKSATNGFILEKSKQARVSVTGTKFVGKRSASVRLTRGTWLIAPRLGQKTYSIVVS